MREQLARPGGDEFALMVGGCADVASATVAGERMRAALEAPFVLDDIPMQIDASVGLALYPQHAATAVELLKRGSTSRPAA